MREITDKYEGIVERANTTGRTPSTLYSYIYLFQLLLDAQFRGMSTFLLTAVLGTGVKTSVTPAEKKERQK